MRNLHLLLIDPQNDFCELPDSYKITNAQNFGGTFVPPGLDPLGLHDSALPVPGAHEDMLRISDLIRQGRRGISDISVTLDSHHQLDIAHPSFWCYADGSPMKPHTKILLSMVTSGEVRTRNPKALPRAIAYLEALLAAGNYELYIWPVHCEISSWGGNVHPDVRAAYNLWEDSELAIVNKVTKGSNPWTEHYSAVMAEVPDPSDPTTQINRHFFDLLVPADQIYVGGEAGSHCVRETVSHIATNFGEANLHKIVLLTDCMSPVPGFETEYKDFLSDMKTKGVRLATAAEALSDFIENSRA